jgi:hypothetical protein
MKRKYMSEFGLHTYSSYLTICYPNFLDTIDIGKNDYHIYMITLIPKLVYDSQSLLIFKDHITINVKVKTEKEEKVEQFAFAISHDINHKDCKFEFDKPTKTLIFFDGKNTIKIGVLSLYLRFSSKNLESEIIYIGQSFGKDGERTAPQRLKSHSTLQKIQSDLLYEGTERDLALILLEFTPRLLSTFDGVTKDYEKTQEEDLAHLEEIFKDPPLVLNNQIINISEAALINYFKPEYNEKFKNNFPDVEHKGYKQYYDLDYNAVCVELDPDAIGLNLYSKENRYFPFNSINYTLHPENVRKSMFEIFKSK